MTYGLPLDNYKVEKILGQGSYGTVFKCRHKLTNAVRAMKKLPKQGKEKEQEIINEIDVLKLLDHPNIIKIFEFYNTKDGYYLITEICKGGELFEKITSKDWQFDEIYCAYIMYQIFSSIFYCHTMNIIHRDLKPENILIENEDHKGYLNIKIIDFGTAKLFEKDKSEKKVIGSAYYIAPEVLFKNYNHKCDLWSCGVILYIMLSGRAPFSGDTDEEITQKIKIGTYEMTQKPWHKISKDVKDLISKLLEKDPNKRISADVAMEHKWFKKLQIKEKFTHVGKEKLRKFVSNLKQFKFDCKLQEVALAFLVHNSLHLDEVKETYKAFKIFDDNGDGKITKEEMIGNLKRMLQFEDESVEEAVEEIFKNVDTDNNGYLEYEEFVRACIDKEKLLTDDILKYTFNFFDKDGSGDITFDEIKAVFCKSDENKISDHMINQMMDEVDLDGNRVVDFDEFKKMMRKIISRGG